MEAGRQDKVAAFDAAFTDNRIRKLKLFMPYLESSLQKSLAVCIRLLELNAAVSFSGTFMQRSDFDFGTLCEEMLPYCSAQERQALNSLQNMLRTFSQYREMMEFMEMMRSMQEIFPDGADRTEGAPDGADRTEGAPDGADRAKPGPAVAPGGMDPGQLADMKQMADMLQTMFAFMKDGGENN